MLKEVAIRPVIKSLVQEGSYWPTHHDAFMAEPREDDSLSCCQHHQHEMEQPVQRLALSDGTDAKVGPCWHDDEMRLLTLRLSRRSRWRNCRRVGSRKRLSSPACCVEGLDHGVDHA